MDTYITGGGHCLRGGAPIGHYVARLAAEEKHLAMVVNGHPLVPHSAPRAGFRLVPDGLSTELLTASRAS